VNKGSGEKILMWTNSELYSYFIFFKVSLSRLMKNFQIMV